MTTERIPRLDLEEKIRLAAEPSGPGTITYDEFMAWADEDTLAEWVDRKVEMASPASYRHQRINIFLTGILTTYATVLDLGVVLNAPFQMRLPRSGREPDLLFLRHEHLDRLRETRLDGPADLVVEIISPESVTRDRVTKLQEYARDGVPESWLVDPDRRTVAFYQRDTDGAYQLIAPDAAGIYRSRAIHGFRLDVAWLWRDPLPGVDGIVLAVAGEVYARYLQSQLRHACFDTAPTDG